MIHVLRYEMPEPEQGDPRDWRYLVWAKPPDETGFRWWGIQDEDTAIAAIEVLETAGFGPVVVTSGDLNMALRHGKSYTITEKSQ
jgi:hypothetical protein